MLRSFELAASCRKPIIGCVQFSTGLARQSRCFELQARDAAMTKKKIFEIINNNPIFYLATCEENEPRVRGMRVYRADEKGIIFNTSTAKELHEQLLKNPMVELCFYDETEGIQIRIRGEVEPFDDQAIKDEIVEKMPALKPLILGEGEKKLAVYRLARGKVKVWKIDPDFAPRIMAGDELTSVWMALCGD
jgi:pyridoxamine 5'-phosphate oxidase